MDGGSRECTLEVSQHFFHLTTESLRLRSNQTKRYETLTSFLDTRIKTARRVGDHDAATLREHLATIPTNGPILISFDISETNATALSTLRDQLSAHLDTELSLGDAVSILLFDYVVDQKSSRILDSLGLDEATELHGELIANDPQ